MNPDEIFWNMYKLFNDPPGTKRQLKCVNCKLALAGTSLTTGGLLMFLGKRRIKSNVYVGMTLGVSGLTLLGLSAFVLKMASENHKFNKNFMEEQRKKQLSNFEKLKESKAQVANLQPS